MAKRDNKLAARILAEAVLSTDEKVAERHGVTRRTVVNYRNALNKDPELSQLFRETLDALLTRSWVDELDAGLREIINQIRARANALPQNAEAYMAIVEAAKALGEIAVAREVLSAASGEGAAATTPSHQTASTHLPN